MTFQFLFLCTKATGMMDDRKLTKVNSLCFELDIKMKWERWSLEECLVDFTCLLGSVWENWRKELFMCSTIIVKSDCLQWRHAVQIICARLQKSLKVEPFWKGQHEHCSVVSMKVWQIMPLKGARWMGKRSPPLEAVAINLQKRSKRKFLRIEYSLRKTQV